MPWLPAKESRGFAVVVVVVVRRILNVARSSRDAGSKGAAAGARRALRSLGRPKIRLRFLSQRMPCSIMQRFRDQSVLEGEQQMTLRNSDRLSFGAS